MSSDHARLDDSTARRLVAAAAWRTRLTEMGADSSAAFEMWLAEDPRNAAAWRQLQIPWDYFSEHATSPELLAARSEALGYASAIGSKRWARHRPVGGRTGAAIAATVILVVAAGVLAWAMNRPAVFRTAAGEQRVVTLEDGSQIALDSKSEVRIDFSEKARDLVLLRGQARFSVFHDPTRPFSVMASGQKVVATGTTFNVDMLDTTLFVTLVEGHVVVLPAVAATSSGALPLHANTTANDKWPAEIELSAGEQLVVNPSGAVTVQPVNLEFATSWERGQLIFENELLSSVIARMGRYSDRHVRITDDESAQLRISGVFNAVDLDGFVTTISSYLPVQGEIGTDGSIELHRR